MIDVKRLRTPTEIIRLGTGDEHEPLPPLEAAEDIGSARSTAIIPIRSLGENHRERIAQHLLSLAADDRYLRFGYVAQDAQIRKYADSLDFTRDEVFGIYNRNLKLIAVAHMAVPELKDLLNCAEFGVSVLPSARGKGYGGRLFERAALSASNAGIRFMFIHALSENVAMLKIARRAGARVERDGGESEAYLKLPDATVDTHLTEIIEEQVALIDYKVKLQAKQFRDFLQSLHAKRQSMHDTESGRES